MCDFYSHAHARMRAHEQTIYWFNSSTSCCADCLFMEAGLVAADRLYTTKRHVLEDLGMGTSGSQSAILDLLQRKLTT